MLLIDRRRDMYGIEYNGSNLLEIGGGGLTEFVC